MGPAFVALNMRLTMALVLTALAVVVFFADAKPKPEPKPKAEPKANPLTVKLTVNTEDVDVSASMNVTAREGNRIKARKPDFSKINRIVNGEVVSPHSLPW